MWVFNKGQENLKCRYHKNLSSCGCLELEQIALHLLIPCGYCCCQDTTVTSYYSQWLQVLKLGSLQVLGEVQDTAESTSVQNGWRKVSLGIEMGKLLFEKLTSVEYFFSEGRGQMKFYHVWFEKITLSSKYN